MGKIDDKLNSKFEFDSDGFLKCAADGKLLNASEDHLEQGGEDDADSSG